MASSCKRQQEYRWQHTVGDRRLLMAAYCRRQQNMYNSTRQEHYYRWHQAAGVRHNMCSVSRWRPHKVDKRMVLEYTHGLFTVSAKKTRIFRKLFGFLNSSQWESLMNLDLF
jgi:hypothetical protein